jgi:predicted dehydrogenase
VSATPVAATSAPTASLRRPRLGFLGVGWIGRHRMGAIAQAGVADVAAIADPSQACRDAARESAPDAVQADGLDELLSMGLDGLVIATPSAQHADQSRRALDAGLPVFCQKPLGRTAAEVDAVVSAARRADRLLGVDLSYRFTEGARAIRDLVRRGELGEVFAVDLTFHNAYGPDKAWFYDAAQSGGGCVMDLGVHLVDLALWALDFPAVRDVSGDLLTGGRPTRPGEIEDYASATVRLENGGVLRLACSWRLNAGQDAEIAAAFYGRAGGAALRNVEGSFYDFTAERFAGTSREKLAAPPDAWGGRAAVAWARRLGEDPGFDPDASRLIDVARVLDAIYRR